MNKKISKTHLSRRAETKSNPYLVNTIFQLKKTNLEAAQKLSFPRKRWPALNLSQIDRLVKDGEKVFIAGKILSSGDLTKKVKIIAWDASEKAIAKIKESKSEFSSVQEEIKTNKDLKGVRIL